MERAETRAAPVILALLEDVRVALANRVDCGSIAKDLVSATQALRAAEPESEQASSCQQRVAVLWAALINSGKQEIFRGSWVLAYRSEHARDILTWFLFFNRSLDPSSRRRVSGHAQPRSRASDAGSARCGRGKDADRGGP
jgi:hypothetical protein